MVSLLTTQPSLNAFLTLLTNFEFITLCVYVFSLCMVYVVEDREVNSEGGRRGPVKLPR